MPLRRLVALALPLALLAGCGEDPDAGPGPATVTATTSEPSPSQQSDQPDERRPPEVVGTVASGLAVPWGLDFLPDRRAVVTERDSARVLVVDPDGGDPVVAGTVDEAAPQGEAGLLGVAVSPSFRRDSTIYLYVSTDTDNRVVRATLEDDVLGEREVVLDGIPLGGIHDGGRLAFGPDGFLYVSTGETGVGELSQDPDSLGGKILRITPDGEPAPGNPDPGSPVWSLGHRNVQGLAFDDDDRLWASELGQNTYDELNLIEPDANYGWPEAEGRSQEESFTNPRVVWSTGEASPSGLTYVDGTLWMAALGGVRLWRVDVDGGRASNPTDFFVGEYGRLRTVVTAPDGMLWVTTSNRDGRGAPSDSDDRILLVDPGTG
ncbi:PQQ-dependent sugar dehydrogenase [Nocardioides aestuarii]|uniref:PQQ-dependent sugar dehydrogenase n=1 Tax=Nocardioides aestuarii TaxID=252231 RepID=A0ABW4TIH0_9ACTN